MPFGMKHVICISILKRFTLNCFSVGQRIIQVYPAELAVIMLKNAILNVVLSLFRI